jgi:hypothetical protein
MPATSQAQRELLNAKFGHKWVQAHHFDNKGKLPEKVRKKKPSAKQHKRMSDFVKKHG